MKCEQVKKIVFGVLIWMPFFINAQADLKDFEKIGKSYQNARAYQVELKYSSYNDYQTLLETDGFTTEVFVEGNNYYCKRTENEFLINERYRLMIDHENKMVVIDENNKDQQSGKRIMTEMGLDSLLQQIAEKMSLQDPKITIEQKKLNEKEKQYILDYSNGEYTTVKINYSNSSFLINKIILYYREAIETEEGKPKTKPRVEISYVHTNLTPHFNKQLFSEKKYAQVKKGGQLELSAALKNYKVINHLLK